MNISVEVFHGMVEIVAKEYPTAQVSCLLTCEELDSFILELQKARLELQWAAERNKYNSHSGFAK